MEKEQNLEFAIKAILRKLNFKMRNLGYKFWVECIKWAFVKDKKFSITKEMYVQVAEICNTTPSRLERSLRHMIDMCQEDIQSYFGVHYRVCNSEFVELMLDEIKNLYISNGKLENA